MEQAFILKNCLISTGHHNDTQKVDIFILNGKIHTISETILDDYPVIDINLKLVVPGAIDPHVHFNDPGYTHHEDFFHGTASAAKGGVTTIIDMPCTSIPPVTDLNKLKYKQSIIESKALVDYALWGGISGASFSDNLWVKDMENLYHAGVIGFKTYALSGMDTFPALSNDQLKQVLLKAKDLDTIIGHHAEDADIIRKLTEKYITLGRNDTEAYWLSRPEEAEILACERASALANQLGAALHIVHVASAKAVQIAQNSHTTLETCPHYLAFGKEDLTKMGSILKTAPVVKTKEDTDKLWNNLASGKIQFLATDHAPCTLEEKNSGSIWTDYSGIPGTELMLNFAYSEGVRKGRLSLSRMIQVTSGNAAMRFGLYPQKGTMLPGSDADFAVIDPDISWIVDSKLQSKGQFTPFEGFSFKGKIVNTYLRGNKIYDTGTGVVSKPIGRWIRPNH